MIGLKQVYLKLEHVLCLLVLLMLPICMPGEGDETLKFQHLSIEDGLSQSTINTFLQDRKGFMWFGTQDGLNRYDGVNFVIHKYSPDSTDVLSDNYINALCEDSNGKLWIGTNNGGLNCFDPSGECFTQYRHRENGEHSNEVKNKGTISNDRIKALFEDRWGYLWIGTTSGLDCFDRRLKTFTNFKNMPGDPNSLSHNDVRCIAEDPHGNLWIGTWGGGLNRYNYASGTFTRFTTPPKNGNRGTNKGTPGLVDNRISSILVLRRPLEFPPRESPPHGAPTVIRRQMGNAPIDTTDDQNQKEEACAYKGIAFTLYIGTCDGFSHFDSLTGAFTPYNKPPGTPNSLTNNTINALYKGFGEEGHIWLGTEKGLHRFNRKTGKITNFSNHPNAPKSLANNWIYSFYRDRSGVFWIGTGADGIYKVNPYGSQFVSYLKHVDTPHSQVDSSIDDIYLGSKGKLWLGTAGGLKIFDRATQQFTHYKHEPDNPHSLSYTEVRCIYEDASGVFWIGTRGGGLNRFDRDKETFTHNYAPPVADDHFNFDKVDCIFEDRSRRLWVGYYGGGLNCLAPDRKQYAHYRHQPQNPNSLTDDCIGSICQDRSGIFWLGGQQGLNRLDLRTGKITHFKHRHDEPGSLSHDYILCIFEDSRGALWIGTQGGGFNRLDKQENRFAHFTEKNGLPNNVVYGIMEDDDGLLWLSTNKGLAQFNRETGRFTNYAGADGLQSDEFNFGAYCKSKDGEFFFGGINGFNAFFPRDILKNSYEPPIVFTKFSIFNKEVHIGRLTDGRKVLPKSITELETLVLTYDDTIFSLQFAALNYVSPEKNQYAYMMEGFEKEWNYVGNRNFVSYNSLKAGQYTFRVKGSNNDGLWNREGASVRIIIIPPFWQSKLFKFFMFALALGLVYFFYRLHIRSMEKRSRMLEEVVNRRTEEVQKEREVAEDANLSKSRFLARMSHEIRTPMNAVIGFTEMLQDTRLSEEQAEFVRSIRQGGQTLLILIDDILDFSKIEAGKLTFEPIDFDLEVTAFDVCELMAPRIDGRPIELRCLIDENVPALVIGDAGRFRQVFINLIGNAIKFTERGEVRLSLDVDKEKDNRLLIHTRIKDTGIGISEDKVNAIFEEFKQADDSTTRKFGGTGLGLAICRQIARLMDGNVWAESRVGHGSVFHFTAWVQKSSKTQLPRKILPHLRGRRVLIADDNADNMEIVTYYLEKMGMQVTALDTAEKVPLFLQENADSGNPMDLCILDIHSPGIKGREILENIRNNPSYSALPVLAFTTSTINRTGDFREWGFDGVLPRPVHRRKLVQMITRLLSEADSEAEPIDEIADLPPVTPETPVQRGWDKSAARQETVIHSPRPWLTQHSLAEEAKHSVCILLVEDNPINCKLAGFMLTKAGYHVHTVHNGKEAVDTFSASPENFDLIFMDVQMPVMDGKEATKQIRAKGFTQVPIIAVTADVIKGEREKLLAIGMSDYISKPIKREVVFKIVRKWT